tara:strand:+ start:1040 stop:1783 length:744 start_codon:yes stop_codon:yes gene_type:complete
MPKIEYTAKQGPKQKDASKIILNDYNGLTQLTPEELAEYEKAKLPENTISMDLRDLGDFTKTVFVSDEYFTHEDIEKYYEKAISNKEHLLAEPKVSIEEDWVQEIWDRVRTNDIKLQSVDLTIHRLGESDKNFETVSTGDLYTIIVSLTPDMLPEDGGTLEFWTPNLTDRMKEYSIDTPYGLSQEKEHNKEIITAVWPKPGRMTIFDSRIPTIMSTITSNEKKRVSLVFKGTTRKEKKEGVAFEIDY